MICALGGRAYEGYKKHDNIHHLMRPEVIVTSTFLDILRLNAMAAPKILIIGASGYLGPYITAEFLRQREKFGRLAVLTEEAKRGKFKSLENQGFEIVVGSFFDKESFEGMPLALHQKHE